MIAGPAEGGGASQHRNQQPIRIACPTPPSDFLEGCDQGIHSDWSQIPTPAESAREGVAGVFDVDDATGGRRLGFGRGVEEEGTHGNEAAIIDGADGLGHAGFPVLDRIL